MLIDSVTIDRLSVPLSSPYHLSLGTITELDLIFVQVQNSAGLFGLGEAATLSGYFDVDIGTVWAQGLQLGENLIGNPVGDAKEIIDNDDFSLLTRSAFAAATGDLMRDKPAYVKAPIVGILSVREGPKRALREAKAQVNAGHETLKVKVGFEPERDAKILDTISSEISDNISLRVDANQGYTLTEAKTFLKNTDESKISLFEQPLQVGNLKQHAKLREKASVPIGLDEEITDEDSLKNAISADAADVVKLKQMKQGGPEQVRILTRLARNNGLGVVLGNGVQSDVGCIQEAQLWQSLDLENAGEFNGWKKQANSIISPSPKFKAGQIIWKGDQIRPNTEFLREYSMKTQQF